MSEYLTLLTIKQHNHRRLLDRLYTTLKTMHNDGVIDRVIVIKGQSNYSILCKANNYTQQEGLK